MESLRSRSFLNGGLKKKGAKERFVGRSGNGTRREKKIMAGMKEELCEGFGSSHWKNSRKEESVKRIFPTKKRRASYANCEGSRSGDGKRSRLRKGSRPREKRSRGSPVRERKRRKASLPPVKRKRASVVEGVRRGHHVFLAKKGGKSEREKTL